jgi:hypothetical protein
VNIVIESEGGIKASDYHTERLEAKLSFLIESHSDAQKDSSNRYEKKLLLSNKGSILRSDAESLDRLEQASAIRYSTFKYHFP